VTDARSIGTPFRTPYPGYNVLDKWDGPSFNDATRRAVADRLHNVPERRFFDEGQYALLKSVIDCILPQPERSPEQRIPVAAFIDEMLHANRGSGTRFAGMPPQREAWPQGLACIDQEAERRHGRGFRTLPAEDQRKVLGAIDAGDIDAAIWTGLDPKRFFRSILLKEAVKIYYAHPLAWNEMGFGGPAAPRGYLRLGPDERDPWEAREERLPQRVGELP
jgi:hypothetical protein